MSRFNIEFSDTAAEQLESQAKTQGRTKAEVIRRALNIATCFDRVQNTGGKILTEDADGKIREVIHV